ncbi:hypothetical protein GCM10010496_05560 [Streptomyces asoensis]|nr:hypothetical protein GCM10010496_05560 [Streptomyces asoensis]
MGSGGRAAGQSGRAPGESGSQRVRRRAVPGWRARRITDPGMRERRGATPGRPAGAWRDAASDRLTG